MRKTAGFLKFLATVGLVLEVIAAIILAICEVALLAVGKFSDLAKKAGDIINIEGYNLTPEEIDAFKPFFLVAIGFGLVAVIFGIMGTSKERAALGEVKNEQPFTQKAVDSLKGAARMEVIGGIIGVVGAVVLMFMGQKIVINGTSVGNTSVTLNLAFLFRAVEKYMHYHIANYGNKLER